MKVLILGATGATGRCITDLALDQSHEVTAFARDPEKLGIRHDRLRVLQGDVFDPATIDGAVKGQQAVIVALGAPTLGPDMTCSTGTRHSVESMQKHGVRRLVVLSSSGVVGDTGLIYRLFHSRRLRHVMADKHRQEDVVEASGLDWVVVRPAQLTDDPQPHPVRVAFDRHPKGGSRISRRDVATFMLAQLVSDKYLHKAPVIAY